LLYPMSNTIDSNHIQQEGEQDMAEDKEGKGRGQLGYGSTYRKGTRGDLKSKSGIGTVLGGQVWVVKPDKKARPSNPCIWMQSGAVEFKNCNNFYDCTTCKYDVGMSKNVQKERQISWQGAMRRRVGTHRICRHTLTHRVGARLCAYDYQCSKCDFDQFFEEVWSAKTPSPPSEVRKVKGFDVPLGYYFHNGHTWAKIESGGFIRIGMDDFAMKLLGEADGFDLPLMGKELDQGRVGWGLNRHVNTADMLSPIGGVIVDVNAKVRENPSIANREPYESGWLFTVRTPDVKESVNTLKVNEQTVGWIAEEVNALESMIEQVAGPLAADGGHLAGDIYGALPELGWNNLTKRFLRT
jgi:glycine cleavage system H lipoate-binding protein